MEKSPETSSFFDGETLEGTDVEVIHILPPAYPVERDGGVVTFLFCTDEEHPDGLIIYGGSEDEEGLIHQMLFDLAQDEIDAIGEKAEGHWGGLIKMPSLRLIRESHGFAEKPDREIFNKFLDYLEEKHI